MAPFNLRTFNHSVESGDQDEIELVDRLIPLAERYLGASGKEREAAGLLIARLLTRRDVNDFYIPRFLSRSMTIWNSDDCTINFRTGLMTCLCEIFKIGSRDVLLTHVDIGLASIRQMEGSSELLGNILLRKLRMKLAQRIALTLLRPHRASWRYKNDPKSLRGTNIPDEDITDDPPEAVEEIIGVLLEGLQDKDTVVRYSAAKGLGSITSRLPISYALEVLDAIRGLFEVDTRDGRNGRELLDHAKDSTWHGSALAVAELCRNGALVPSALLDIIPYIFVAMRFDIKKGTHSIGTPVRDAACYVMWSILRCYKTDIVLPFATKIATGLIVVAMFDREISVRRAASAAYQEGVGRHSDNIFPDGIAVLSKADFFAVGQRLYSFLEVAPAVFLHQDYQTAILQYLVEVSCAHWDRPVRELAGQTLGRLTKIEMPPEAGTGENPTVVQQNSALLWKVLDEMAKLEHLRTSVDVNARHGAFYAVGELCSSLGEILPGMAAPELFSVTFIQRLVSFGVDLPLHNLKGPQAALMYQAVCHYISRATILEIQVLDYGTVEIQAEAAKLRHTQYVNLAISAFTLNNEQVRLVAAEAARSLYLLPHIEQTLNKLINQNSGSAMYSVRNPAVLKGWLLFLGLVEYADYETTLPSVITVLSDSARICGDATRDDPETRKIAVTSLGQLVPQLCSSISHIPKSTLFADKLLDSLSLGVNDYTVDSRGDAGSWVRQAAVIATCEIFRTLHFWEIQCSTEKSRFITLFSDCVSQCLGKIDNLRIVAITELEKTICKILTADTVQLNMEPLHSLFSQTGPILAKAVQELNAGNSSLSLFSNLVALLNLEELRIGVLREYLITGSSGSQSTMTIALSTLTTYLDSLTTSSLLLILSDIVRLIDLADGDDRILVPVLTSTADLLESQTFNSLSHIAEFDSLFSIIQKRTLNSPVISKIVAALKCYAALATFDHPVRHRAWKKLGMGLGHKFPNVRVLCAELVFQVLSNLGIEEEGDSQAVIEAVTEVDWSAGVDASRAKMVTAFTLP